VNYGTYEGGRLADFVTKEMVMSSYYQPLLIKSLVESGGRRSVLDLARLLLLHDGGALARARRTLMRWPRSTLARHGIAFYDKATQEFVLPVRFDDARQRQLVIDTCNIAIATWDRREAPRQASQFYRIIERAGGRCQACGIPGSIRPIDVDHIQARASTRNSKVTLPDGTRVPLDDDRNLQALCTRCNRGKRDTSAHDFRPSADRLRETIVLSLQQAQSHGYDWESILTDARAELA
jgi:5-methylcytosine-specific restriction endonuclease McrA